MIALGTLTKVDRSEAWLREDTEFTPWLCRTENLAILSDTLQIQIEFVKSEFNVGQFRLDILAKRAESDETIIIENQFGTTDHSHLGQLMTYAAGVGSDGSGARTVIWIAERFSEPHRSALDWLNKCTEPGIRFFGVEIELWRIGNSAPAPRFNLVSKPNDWQKAVTQQSSSLSDTEKLYLEFWSFFIKFCEDRETTLSLPNAWARHWLPTFIGRSGFGINLTASQRDKKLECQLWLEGNTALSAYNKLSLEKATILSELGPTTIFDEMEGRKSCKIYQLHSGDITNRNDWIALCDWLKERGEAYRKTFMQRIKVI